MSLETEFKRLGIRIGNGVAKTMIYWSVRKQGLHPDDAQRFVDIVEQIHIDEREPTEQEADELAAMFRRRNHG